VETRHFRVADLVFAATSAYPPPWQEADHAYAPFECQPAPPDASVRESEAPPRPLEDATRVFTSGSLWNVHRVDGRTVFSLAPAGTAPTCVSATFEPDLRHGEIHYHAPHCDRLGQPLYPLMYPLFHLLTVSLLGQGHGLMLHASAVDVAGRGLLFPAISGGGKTTLARLWRGAGTVLSDERVIVRWREGRPWIYGTPWHGELAETAGHGVPLAGIFFPDRGHANRVTLLRPAAAAARLVPRWLQPCWDAAAVARTLDLVHDLVTTTPCSELAFVPDHSVVDFLRCAA
jgi:hypothetical protein